MAEGLEKCLSLANVSEPCFREVDEALSKQPPFGSTDYIASRLKAVYERRLVKLSDRFPRAGELVDKLTYAEPERSRRVLADTLVPDSL